MAGLGTGTQTAQRVGTAAGGIITSAAPALIAAGPVGWAVLAGGALADIFSGVIGPDPRNVPDTQAIEAAQIALNQLWFQISGEQLPIACQPGRCGAQHVAIFSQSAYPNVPKGAQGDLSIDPAQALAAANAIIAQARGALLKPASAQNSFFQPGGGNNIPGLIQRMATARQAAAAARSATTTATTSPGSGSLTLGALAAPLAGSSPLLWIALGLGAVYLFARG